MDKGDLVIYRSESYRLVEIVGNTAFLEEINKQHPPFDVDVADVEDIGETNVITYEDLKDKGLETDPAYLCLMEFVKNIADSDKAQVSLISQEGMAIESKLETGDVLFVEVWIEQPEEN